MDVDGFELINTLNSVLSRRLNFNKKIDLITKTSFYLNQLKALNSTCARKHVRERRQLDNAFLTAADFTFKKMRERVLDEKIDELSHLNVENLSTNLTGECHLSH